MKLYLVRHGESELGAVNSHQFPETPLSPLGVKQAEYVAKRLREVPVDIIISSTYQRAKQTADIIGGILGLDVEHNQLFSERKRPSVIRGRRTDDPEVVAIKEEMRARHADPNYHHSDEENFSDVFKRIKSGREYIEALKNEHVLLVSHGTFITFLIGMIILGDEYDSSAAQKMIGTTVFGNTGVSVCEYKNGKWRLLMLNDMSHLPS